MAALLSIAVPLVPDRAAPLPVLSQDNFDAGQNSYEHDDEIATPAHDQGGCRMAVKRPEQEVLSDTCFRGGVDGEPLICLTDLSVRVRAQAVRAGAVLGAFCRHPSGGSYQAVLAPTARRCWSARAPPT